MGLKLGGTAVLRLIVPVAHECSGDDFWLEEQV